MPMPSCCGCSWFTGIFFTILSTICKKILKFLPHPFFFPESFPIVEVFAFPKKKHTGHLPACALLGVHSCVRACIATGMPSLYIAWRILQDSIERGHSSEKKPHIIHIAHTRVFLSATKLRFHHIHHPSVHTTDCLVDARTLAQHRLEKRYSQWLKGCAVSSNFLLPLDIDYFIHRSNSLPLDSPSTQSLHCVQYLSDSWCCLTCFSSASWVGGVFIVHWNMLM